MDIDKVAAGQRLQAGDQIDIGRPARPPAPRLDQRQRQAEARVMITIAESVEAIIGLSQVLAQAGGIVDRRVDITARDAVSDAIEGRATVAVGFVGLRAAFDQRMQVHLAPVDRPLLQVEIERVVGQGAELDDDLIDQPLFLLVGEFVAQHGHQLVAFAVDLGELEVGRRTTPSL